jgi:ergothioneine biosynthesis protein EgtB
MQHKSEELLAKFQDTRAQTKKICESLELEDCIVQPEEDVSPPRWHLAHTTWFFEAFVLRDFYPSYMLHDQEFFFLFNSYYDGEGERLARNLRGSLSRPTLREIYAYRTTVDHAIGQLLRESDLNTNPDLMERLVLGLNHEEQHQELLFTDIKAILAANPSRPPYNGKHPESFNAHLGVQKHIFKHIDAGNLEIGATRSQFSFDNERPRHITYLGAFELARSLVTNLQYLEFIADGGYRKPNLWLADGWTAVQTLGWRAPRYWQQSNESWTYYTLSGETEVDPNAAVCHISYFEADAFARWSGARLPTEQEWERAAVDSGDDFSDLFGTAWQWTSSGYSPYPGFIPESGTIGEYNGKFMCNQMVLKGSSWATPLGHSRATYRNFFHCDKRWQVTAIRLARTV